MKNNLLKYGLLAIMWLVTALPVLAFPGDPDDGDDPLPAPIDNWMIILVLVAASIGIYFTMKYNEKAIA